jgi:hypothetical protein
MNAEIGETIRPAALVCRFLISVPTALADTLMRNENRSQRVSDVSNVSLVSERPPYPVFESRFSPLLPFGNGPMHRQVTAAAPLLPSSDGGSGLMPRRGEATKRASQNLALANGGQKRPWFANGLLASGSGGWPEADRDGHGRTQPCCLGRLSAKGRQVNWRRTLDNGGQNRRRVSRSSQRTQRRT